MRAELAARKMSELLLKRMNKGMENENALPRQRGEPREGVFAGLQIVGLQGECAPLGYGRGVLRNPFLTRTCNMKYFSLCWPFRNKGACLVGGKEPGRILF